MQRANFKAISTGERPPRPAPPVAPARSCLISIFDPETWPESGRAYWEARRDEYLRDEDLKERSEALAQSEGERSD